MATPRVQPKIVGYCVGMTTRSNGRLLCLKCYGHDRYHGQDHVVPLFDAGLRQAMRYPELNGGYDGSPCAGCGAALLPELAPVEATG